MNYDDDEIDRGIAMLQAQQAIEAARQRQPAPAQIARANTLARRTGTQPEVADNTLDDLSREVAAADALALVRKYPRATDWISRPRNAGLAHGATPQLDATLKPFVAMTDPFTSYNPLTANHAGELGFGAGTGNASYLGASGRAGLWSAGALAAQTGADLTISSAVHQIPGVGDLVGTMYDAVTGGTADNIQRSAFSSVASAAQRRSSQETDPGQLSPAAQQIAALRYGTTDASKSAFLSPTRMFGDALQSLPPMAVLVASAYATRGASLEAMAGLEGPTALAAAAKAGAKTMARVGAVGEGIVGAEQQKAQVRTQIEDMPIERLNALSPEFRLLTTQGMTPEAARTELAERIGSQAGASAGAVDALAAYFGGHYLGKIIGEGGRLVARTARGFAIEGLQEGVQSAGEQLGANVATMRADNTQTAFEGVNENFWQGVGVGGLMGGTTASVFANTHHQATDAAATVRQSDALNAAMEAAASDKVRALDPEAFRELIAAHTEGTASDHVYIPAEAIRSFNQDYRDDEFFRDYSDQIDEALSHDGDVAIPTAALAAGLAGKPAWEALKDQTRFSPGGMSPAEARAFTENGAAHLDELAAQIRQHGDESTGDPAGEVYQQVRRQLREAGFTPDIADKYASMWAANRQAWAERMGTDALSYHVANPLEIRRVLPEALATARGADNLDLVINAMRRGKDSKAATGPSLLEWISKQGGVEDRGGDIASMGGDKWHVGKPGKRKLIRDHNPAQASMLGADGQRNTNSLDELANRAQEAGYFPDHTERPTTAELLDAIGNELRGNKVFATAAGEDQTRIAADDLRRLLDDRGIDPDKASKAEIKAAIDTFHGEQLVADRSFDKVGRGRAIFGEKAGAIIELFSGSDLSTFIHETGHVWLEELAKNAAKELLQDIEGEWVVKMRAKDLAGFAVHSAGVVAGIDPERARINDQLRASIAAEGVKEPLSLEVDTARGTAQLQNGNHRAVMANEIDPEMMIPVRIRRREAKRVQPAGQQYAGNSIAQDWETVKDWFAANGHAIGADGVIPVGAHELWARGWEAYAMEGKAPSTALRRAFDSFRAWLSTIYKTVKALNAPISPEIREVFGRLLATQQEIDNAEQRQNMRALFTDAAQAGMTEEAFKAYQAATGDARNAAYSALLEKTMARVRRERTAEWKREAASIRDDVTESINKRPEFVALNLLRTGNWLNDPERAPMKVRLDRGSLVEVYGEDALALLPKSVPPIYGEGGMDADSIAEMVGFRSGDDMIRALMAVEAAQKVLRDAGDKRSVRVSLIEQQVAETMTDRHGDALNDGTIEEEALAAVHNDQQGEMIATEARALWKRGGSDRPPTPYSVAREWAVEKVSAGQVAEVASRAAMRRYARTAAKAAKDAEVALVKGNIDEAFRQKQMQLLNHALLVEAKKAANDIDAIVGRLSKIAKRATMKSVDQDYLDRAHAMLEGFDFRPRSQRSIDAQGSFEAWANEQRAEGIDVVVPPRYDANGTNYTRVSVEDLRSLDESVEQILHLGRFKQDLIDAAQARDYREARGEMIAATEPLSKVKPDPNILTAGGKVKKFGSEMHAMLVKMERMIDILDGGDPNGPFNRLIWRPLADAQHRAATMRKEFVAKLVENFNRMPTETMKRMGDKVSVPELPGLSGDTTWTRGQLMQMAKNAGTADNWAKLTNGYGWDAAAAMGALDRVLSKEEWEHVQGELEIVGAYWPMIEAMYKRINGIAPPKVAARPIETRHGTFSGGYYPLIADANANPGLEGKISDDAMFGELYTRATTSNGFTKERTGAKYVVSVAEGLTKRHVVEVIHDLTHREAVRQAAKFLSDAKVKTAMRSVLGTEVERQFMPWLKYIANQWSQDRTGAQGLEKIASKLRTSMSIMGMGLRISTALQQVAGYANSVEALGTDAERWMASGSAVVAVNPMAATRFVMERSSEIANRIDSMDATQEAELAKLEGRSGLAVDARRFAFHLIGYMDRAVVIPTWHAAYNKAQAQGMSEADSIAYGDKIVRHSQGAGGAMNSAAIQRKRGLGSLFVMFYSYGSAYYNRQSQLARDWKGAVAEGRTRDVPRLIARTWWLMFAPNIVSTLIQQLLGQAPDEDDKQSYAGWFAANMVAGVFAGVPGARDVVNALARGFDYASSPVDRMGITMTHAATDIWHSVDDYVPGFLGGDPDGETHASKRSTRNAIETVGYATQLPLGPLAPAAQFVVDWGNGDAHPETVGDWAEGLQTGKNKHPG